MCTTAKSVNARERYEESEILILYMKGGAKAKSIIRDLNSIWIRTRRAKVYFLYRPWTLNILRRFFINFVLETNAHCFSWFLLSTYHNRFHSGTGNCLTFHGCRFFSIHFFRNQNFPHTPYKKYKTCMQFFAEFSSTPTNFGPFTEPTPSINALTQRIFNDLVSTCCKQKRLN